MSSINKTAGEYINVYSDPAVLPLETAHARAHTWTLLKPFRRSSANRRSVPSRRENSEIAISLPFFTGSSDDFSLDFFLHQRGINSWMMKFMAVLGDERNAGPVDRRGLAILVCNHYGCPIKAGYARRNPPLSRKTIVSTLLRGLFAPPILYSDASRHPC